MYREEGEYRLWNEARSLADRRSDGCISRLEKEWQKGICYLFLSLYFLIFFVLAEGINYTDAGFGGSGSTGNIASPVGHCELY